MRTIFTALALLATAAAAGVYDVPDAEPSCGTERPVLIQTRTTVHDCDFRPPKPERVKGEDYYSAGDATTGTTLAVYCPVTEWRWEVWTQYPECEGSKFMFAGPWERESE